MRTLGNSAAKRSVIVALLGVAVLVGVYIVWQGVTPSSGTPAAVSQSGSASPSSRASSAPSPTRSPRRTASPSAAASVRPASGLSAVKVMVLGDSISSGAKDEVIDGYRLELLKALPGYPIDYVGTDWRGDDRLQDKNIQAEGGACIRANPCSSVIMYDHTADWITATKPDVVIMQGGGNDYCCGHSDQPDSVVIQAMTDWINLVWKTKPNVYIVVIGMIDYHDDYKAWIPKYVAQLAAAGKHISYVSYDGISTYDTVHPDVAGYKQLAGRIAPVLKPTLNKLLGR
jgi:lysophospholipase L1-like esterase